jgi:hypothetical protein
MISLATCAFRAWKVSISIRVLLWALMATDKWPKEALRLFTAKHKLLQGEDLADADNLSANVENCKLVAGHWWHYDEHKRMRSAKSNECTTVHRDFGTHAHVFPPPDSTDWLPLPPAGAQAVPEMKVASLTPGYSTPCWARL